LKILSRPNTVPNPTTSDTFVTCMSDNRRGSDWWLDLLVTYTHNSQLQVIITLSFIYTLYRSLEHTLRLFSLLPLVVSWWWILTIDTIQLLCSRLYCPANIPQLAHFSSCLLIASRHWLHRKHRSSVAVQLLLIKKSLPSSRRCFRVCFAVVT
jgi:hypothetical protein